MGTKGQIKRALILDTSPLIEIHNCRFVLLLLFTCPLLLLDAMLGPNEWWLHASPFLVLLQPKRVLDGVQAAVPIRLHQVLQQLLIDCDMR